MASTQACVDCGAPGEAKLTFNLVDGVSIDKRNGVYCMSCKLLRLGGTLNVYAKIGQHTVAGLKIEPIEPNAADAFVQAAVKSETDE